MYLAEEKRNLSKPSFGWLVKLLGPVPGLKEIHVACWGLFVAFLVVPMCVLLWIQVRMGPESIRKLHPDFVYFYGVGSIVRDYPAARLYDRDLQLKTFNSLAALQEGVYGPSPYPPFVAQFFSVFARIPFEPAYLAWASVSLLLYWMGIAAIAREIFPVEPLKRSLIVCLSLAFYPFVMGTLVNGQLAAVAVCAISFGIYQERHGRPFASGLLLSILIYKPTLLLLIVPMLLVTRRYRALLGFASGAALWMAIATMVAGFRIWPAYLHFLSAFGSTAGVGGKSALQLWKYVDFSSLLNASFPGRSGVSAGILFALAAMLAIALGVLLWRSAAKGQPVQSLAWAATLTWTLLLNVYVPIYDTAIVAIAVILTLGAVRDLAWESAGRWTVLLAVLLLGVSWVTVPTAKTHGFQLMTLLLTVLGLAQLFLLHRSMRRGSFEQRPGWAALQGSSRLGRISG